ncbi:saccharopine dehydrogenase NAD+ L-glutamate forming protein [Salinisphaera shabanensis E1L3A]|uniref:Saccharopine dehydrogenase NAD+ L-glutamate forming protein n=1 Tax=Salinisphaera shabanensis E1L3A TaxID=1033802 RepID=U2EKZ2_9GAMM|nr:saccharopine dehydrogenase NADP-binding domain-containing protein [Salinisphaera shabanensis]ERJ18595.1 saccharopine dehydrogenase NAD+ L-glutamate forming protein [Salinisphaera shabanensis E1L3A]
MDTPAFDIVVFGATSFVGQLTCRYLAERYGDDSDVRWAMAGRSKSKLGKVRSEIGNPEVAMIVADANDADSLAAMCKQTRVVISTVGPYALYGEALVATCADSGTDYCDLTGEVHWIAAMLEKYEARAQASGARIVNCCGFDSLPSDLGVHFLQKHARERFGAPCTRVKMRVKAMRGTFSGGTVASLVNFAKEVRANPALRKQLANPYSICPEGYRPDVRQPNPKGASFDADANSWIAPFIMASCNTRVVQRSNALSGQAYGAEFKYDEAMMTGRGTKGRLNAYGLTAGLGGFLMGVAVKPTRALLQRFVLPEPGEGPSPSAQEKGFYDMRLFGTTAAGEKLKAKVVGDRDPGYGSTSKMLCEAAICLSQRGETEGGFWTPATLLGDDLIERLHERAGVSFELLD